MTNTMKVWMVMNCFRLENNNDNNINNDNNNNNEYSFFYIQYY
jgi:hypothetical protein